MNDGSIDLEAEARAKAYAMPLDLPPFLIPRFE